MSMGKLATSVTIRAVADEGFMPSACGDRAALIRNIEKMTEDDLVPASQVAGTGRAAGGTIFAHGAEREQAGGDDHGS